jgi:hypothetical protein
MQTWLFSFYTLWRSSAEGVEMNIRLRISTVTIALIMFGAEFPGGRVAVAQSPQAAEAVEVTILSSNLANGSAIGEWGFSALAEVDINDQWIAP